MLPIVFLDLDGTLVGSSGQVKEPVWQALEKAKEAGIKLVICTGRPCAGIAKQIAMRLDENSPHIFQNGSLTCFPNGKVVKALALQESVSKKIIDYSREHNLTLEVYTPNEVFVERKTHLSEAHAKMIGVVPIVRDLTEVAETEPVVRAQWVVPFEEADKVLDLKPEGLQVGKATSPALPNTYFISLTRAGVSKGSAVAALAKLFGIELIEAMAVGDSLGDKSMLEVVGHPIVMGGAVPELKNLYTSVSDVEENGVVEALGRALEPLNHENLQKGSSLL